LNAPLKLMFNVSASVLPSTLADDPAALTVHWLLEMVAAPPSSTIDPANGPPAAPASFTRCRALVAGT
jgi:hypothetical protein